MCRPRQRGSGGLETKDDMCSVSERGYLSVSLSLSLQPGMCLGRLGPAVAVMECVEERAMTVFNPGLLSASPPCGYKNRRKKKEENG